MKPGEKWALITLLILIGVGVLIPLQEVRRNLLASTHQEKQRLAAMLAMRDELSQTKPPLRRPTLKGEALRTAVEAAARTSLAPASSTTSLENLDRVRISVSGVAMERLLVWIDSLRRTQGLRLESATIKPMLAGALADKGGLAAELVFSGVGP